jgi:hypothetical protein
MTNSRSRRHLAATLALSLFGAFGCARRPPVETGPTLPLRRVVVYRNGVGYFERQGHVEGEAVNFRVTQSEVGDFLATLAVMEQGGSSVRSAAFPMPEEQVGDAPPAPERRRNVRLALDGREHDLVVGYTVETPIWRPTYRLVFQGDRPQVQAWGIVQNLSGEDWTDVNLSLVSGSPVSFRSELATPVIPERPIVTDRGAVIDAVPQSDTTLAQEQQRAPSPPAAEAAPTMPMGGAAAADAMQDEEGSGAGYGRNHATRSAVARRPSRPGAPPAPSAQPTDGRYYRAPMTVTAPPPPPPSSTPRNLAALAALAVQGGATRYDLPQTVTVPDRSATMVMLVSREVPGEQLYLFAPDPGVGDSGAHPFHVARFENRTGGTLERGPIAIFERNAFLGQGMMESLPDGATTTVPFSLERGIAVESSQTSATEGARLVRMVRETLTIERYSVVRTTYRARNGLDHAVRLLYRHALNGAQAFEPPAGTESSSGNALVPTSVDARGRSEVVLTARTPFSVSVDLGNEQAADAIAAYLRDGHPPDAVAATLRGALDLRRQIADLTQQRDNQVTRRDDLQRNAEETRGNLTAIQRNPAAADLRAQLTARLARTATEIDQTIRRIVELDTQVGERRVRLVEALRGLELDVNAPAAPANAPAR